MFNRYFAGFLAFVFAFIMICVPANYKSEDYHSAAYRDIHLTDTSLGHWDVSTLKYDVNKSVNKVKDKKILPYTDHTKWDLMFAKFWERFFEAPYFKTWNAMIELFLVRLYLAFVWIVMGIPVIALVIYDAWRVRRMRFETFAGRNSILHKCIIGGFWLLTFVTLGLFLLPINFHATIWGSLYLAYLVLLHAFIAQFHRYS